MLYRILQTEQIDTAYAYTANILNQQAENSELLMFQLKRQSYLKPQMRQFYTDKPA